MKSGSYNGSLYIDYASMTAARENNTLIAPAGRVWDLIGKEAKSKLLAEDGIHPSDTRGTYLVAATLANTVFGPP